SRFLRPRRPRHLASAVPLRQAGEALCGSSSPTDPALPGGSAWEKFYGPGPQRHKGPAALFFQKLRVAACPPQATPAPPQTEARSPQFRRQPVEENAESARDDSARSRCRVRAEWPRQVRRSRKARSACHETPPREPRSRDGRRATSSTSGGTRASRGSSADGGRRHRRSTSSVTETPALA